ncbi:hypothetical protein GIB67_034729 [Kingdonia uniflora]|uniref:Uncharacterized protein n=1 Tax=Kingdonia uniflora TaxID=39325 RepID=A0A7J7MLE7_9MAGN|nr:hypothetical protein GIB67_034729 [Kingdonia uniflora]
MKECFRVPEYRLERPRESDLMDIPIHFELGESAHQEIPISIDTRDQTNQTCRELFPVEDELEAFAFHVFPLRLDPSPISSLNPFSFPPQLFEMGDVHENENNNDPKPVRDPLKDHMFPKMTNYVLCIVLPPTTGKFELRNALINSLPNLLGGEDENLYAHVQDFDDLMFLQRIETTIAQLETRLSTRDNGTFPSQTQPNPKDQSESSNNCDHANVVITLRSVKTIDNKVRMPENKYCVCLNPTMKVVEDEEESMSEETPVTGEETENIPPTKKLKIFILEALRHLFPTCLLRIERRFPMTSSNPRDPLEACLTHFGDDFDVDDLINEVNALLDSVPILAEFRFEPQPEQMKDLADFWFKSATYMDDLYDFSKEFNIGNLYRDKIVLKNHIRAYAVVN